MTQLRIGIFCLNDEEQELIQLYFYDGYTCREIGREKHLSFKHTARLINRATTRLRQILDELNA